MFPSLILDKFCLILFKFFLTMDPMILHPDSPLGLKDLLLCGAVSTTSGQSSATALL